MTLAVFKGFLGSSSTVRANSADNEDLVNFYLEPLQSSNRRVEFNMDGTPGVVIEKTFTDAGVGRIRGEYTLNGYDFVVTGQRLYLRAPDGVYSLIPGDLIADDGKNVVIATNRTQAFIVGGGKGYINAFGAVIEITDPDFPAVALGAVEIDGYFGVISSSTSPGSTNDQFQISANGDG